MNQISKVLTLHYRDQWTWFYTPLVILFSIFATNLIIGFLIPSESAVYTGGVTSIFVYLFIMGIIVVAKTFSFAVGMSIRRVDYFIGSIAVGVISSLLFSVIIVFMAQLENKTNGWGERLHYFHFPYINDGTFVEQFGVYMIFLLSLFFFGFLMSSFAKRFGGLGMLILSIGTLLLGSIAVYLLHHWRLFGNILGWFVGKTAIEIAYWIIPFLLLYLLASFLLLRRASV